MERRLFSCQEILRLDHTGRLFLPDRHMERRGLPVLQQPETGARLQRRHQGMGMYFWLTGGPTHAGCDPKTVRLVLSCALFYAMCDCFRLARFNTMLEATPEPYWKHFFTGVPAPGGCWMVLTPAILAIALDARSKYPALADAFQNPWFGMATLIFVGALMASRLPTISLKAIHFTSKGQVQLFVAIALFLIGLLVCDIWLTLGVCGALYVLTVPLTGWLFLRGKAKYERGLTSTHDKL